jgi:hypothetical protein
MAVDALDAESRAFYENTRWKYFSSLMLGALGVWCLGMCSVYGGVAEAANQAIGDSANTDKEDTVFTNAGNGNGFACFLYFMGMIFSWAAALYYSPIINGSPNEKQTLKEPFAVERIR